MKSAYCFYRGNAANKETFDNQKRLCSQIARKNEWEVDGEICEPSLSGMTRMIDRPCIQLLIEKAIQHAFDVLLVADVARLGTDSSELLALYHILRDNNVDIYSAKEDEQVSDLTILNLEMAKQNRVCFVSRKGEM